MLLGAELEGGVGLESTRLGAPIVACGDGGADLLQERRDDVEVGLGVVALPFIGIGRVETGERFGCGRLDGLRSRDLRAARGVGEHRLELVECRLRRSGRGSVGAREIRLEVTERLPRRRRGR